MEALGLSSSDSATLETPSRDGKFLLQLLKGGRNRQKIGDKDHAQEQEEECPSWQLHDPAVAAMGPSRPFPISVGDNNPLHMQSRPPYMSHVFRVGSPHQFHPTNATPSNAFNPLNAFPSTEPAFHPPRGGAFPSIFHENVNTSAHSNSAYDFQSRGDCPPYPALGETSYAQTVEGGRPSYLHRFIPSVNQSFDLQRHPSVAPFPSLSYSVQMNESKTLNSGRQLSQGQMATVDQSKPEKEDSLKVNDREADAHQAQLGTLSHQQFYGNGAELLQLLHGSLDKTSGPALDGGATTPLLGDHQNAGTFSKGTALKVHGPIGPPRNRSLVNNSPGDMLGRFWAVTPSSQKSQDFHSEVDLRPSLGTHKTSSSEVPFNEAIWKGKGDAFQEKQVETLFSSAESGKALPSQSNADARLDMAVTLKSFASNIMPENIQPHAAGNLMHSWGSWNGINGPSQTFEKSDPCYLHQNYHTSSGSRELFEGDQDCNNLKLNSSQGLRTTEPLESHKEANMDLLHAKQIDLRKGAGQRTLFRGEMKRSGLNGIAGQRAVASETQKGRTSEAAHGHGSQAEQELKFQTPKLTKLVSKADEAKRQKRKQQEWRLKQPHLGDSLQQIYAKQCMEDAGPTLAEDDVFVNSENEKNLALVPLASQVEHPGLPSGCLEESVSGPALQEGRQKLEGVMTPFRHDEMESSCLGREDHEIHEDILAKEEQDELFEKFADYLELEGDQKVQDHSRHNKRITAQQILKIPEASMSLNTSREPNLPKQRAFMAPVKKGLRRRADLENFSMELLVIFMSLIPSEAEETRRRQFLSQLDDVVHNKWPGARLFLFGSCANAFGVRNSDIDVCLSVDDNEMSTAELVVRMAEILEAANMQNVQALTHARVPIVKFTDPETDISCDICVNNMLAVVNSKLLHDYSKIDVRLRQLAFIVKYWAKRRQVNETYRGTLSSYAYVLMCIHFLQLRNPPILPCLQGMEHTYSVKVGKIECAYYDQVETLTQFGFQNKDSLGVLVTSFFEYWAFHHDYNHVVISVRTGSFMSKEEKAWTRRIGNERHLICIEDPFEVTHDLGRVVDKHSIRVLRDEFYRAAKIMRHDSNPSLTLFEPYIRETI